MNVQGKHISITGILIFYTRKAAFSQISFRGGIPQNTVTKETDYLVIGRYHRNYHRDKSRKRILAEHYNRKGKQIRFLKEEEFLSMLWSTPIKEEENTNANY